MCRYLDYLNGGDLRSIGRVDELLDLIKSQNDFDDLFEYLFNDDRLVVMRAADAIEKISLVNPSYLTAHSTELIALLNSAKNKELKWHLALMVTRINWREEDYRILWERLKLWALEQNSSKIVRVNAIQALYELASKNNEYKSDFKLIIEAVKAENIASINARLKKLNL